MTTPGDLIRLALKDSGIVGIGQTPSAEDMNDAFTRLNFMLGSWQRKRWLIWHLVDTALVSTGATSYTIGTNGNFNMFRPDKLEAAFVRNLLNVAPNQVDSDLRIIEAREDYNRIAVKTLGSYPQWIFYDSAYPLGNLYPWPVPQASIYEIHITTKEVLSQFAKITDAISLPPEYFDALFYNLAVRLRIAYPTDDPVMLALLQELKGLAKGALNVIRNANTQVPLLQLPAAVLPLSGGGRYNILSDQAS